MRGRWQGEIGRGVECLCRGEGIGERGGAV